MAAPRTYDAALAEHGIQRRQKGQRYAKAVLPPFCFLQGGVLRSQGEVVGLAEVVGTFSGWDGFGLGREYEQVLVQLASDRTFMACYRIAGANWAVVQDYSYLLPGK